MGAGGAAVGADGVRPGLGRGDPEPEVLPSHASDPGGEAVGRDRFVPLRVTDENVVFQVASHQVFSAGTWIVASHRSPIVRGLWGAWKSIAEFVGDTTLLCAGGSERIQDGLARPKSASLRRRSAGENSLTDGS